MKKYIKSKTFKVLASVIIVLSFALIVLAVPVLETAYSTIDNLRLTASSKLSGSSGNTKKACVSLKTWTSPTDRSINIVFVPSGFRGNLQNKYVPTVKRIYEDMKKTSLYSDKISELNVFYSLKENSPLNDFCSHKLPFIAPQFMFCWPLKAKNLTSECATQNVYTIVVDDTTDDAGAGLWMFDMATVSSNFNSGIIAVHEISHAIWGFGDEYADSYNFYSHANSVPNCDVAGCPKWADLVNDAAEGKYKSSRPVGCYPNGCTEGKYFYSGASIMRDMVGTFTPPQERVACCVYKRVSGVYPPALCNQFKNTTKSLDSFCSTVQVTKGQQTLDNAQNFKYNSAQRDWELVR